MEKQTKNIIMNRRGFTLVEGLVAGAISAVVLGVVFTFVSFTSEATRETRIMQRLYNDCSHIAGQVASDIRKGKRITEPGQILEPNTDIYVSAIRVWEVDGDTTDYWFDNNNLKKKVGGGQEEIITPRINTTDSSNQPQIMLNKDGMHADFLFGIYDSIQGKRYNSTPLRVRARCKNFEQKVLEHMPDFQPLRDVVTWDPFQNYQSANCTCVAGGTAPAPTSGSQNNVTVVPPVTTIPPRGVFK